MKLVYSLTIAIVAAGGLALAQTSTSGTASGSSAPNQLGTPLNGQTNGTTMGTMGTTPSSGDMFNTGFGSGPSDLNANTTPGAGGTGMNTNGSTGFSTYSNIPPYLVPAMTGAYATTPPNPNAPIQGYALPVPQQQQQQNNNDNNGTVSATTMEPQWAPSPTATPASTP